MLGDIADGWQCSKTVEPEFLRPISFLRLLASLSVVVEDDKFGPDLFRGELLEENFVQLAGSNIPRSSMQVLPFPMSFSAAERLPSQRSAIRSDSAIHRLSGAHSVPRRSLPRGLR